MDTSLLIMAAGIGSRYGGGIKQLARVDAAGHIIMDYSVHDAIEAGFNKIVFIIRRDIEADFRAAIGDRIEAVCKAKNVKVEYAFQSLTDVPGAVPEGRTKPWGTGQAVLAARELIDTPFAVINADDYYGKEAFCRLHAFLCREGRGGAEFCMAGFILKNTLSENGGVTRGLCTVNDSGFLTDVVETANIVKTPEGAAVDGRAVDAEAYVSMNMWGLTPEFIPVLEQGMEEFFRDAVPGNPLKAEYLLPTFIGGLLRQGRVSVQVLPTGDKWFGVTYAEDRESVIEEFKKLIEAGVYSEKLFEWEA